MTAVKKPRPKPAGGGPQTMPGEISPDVYLKQFVDWTTIEIE